MKNVKFLKRIVTFILALSLLFGQMTVNTDAKITYRVYYNGHNYHYTGKAYKVYYNNRLISLSSRPAMLVNGYIMIPYMLYLVKKGPKIQFQRNKAERSLTLKYKGRSVKLFLNRSKCYLNGVEKKLETLPFYAKFDGYYKIMVPAKAVAAGLGLGYRYEKSTASVYITGPGSVKTGTPSAAKPAAAAPAAKPAVSDTPVSASKVKKSYLNLKASRFKKLSTSQFIKLIGPIARENYKQSGIRASVTLAQAILESGWGKTLLCQRGNNLFGMKAVISGNTWKGTTWDGKSTITKKTGEEYGGRKVRITATFRAYKNVYLSIQDHSAYLKNAMNGSRRRYAGITKARNYAQQIRIIKKGGYATSSDYVSNLMRLIRQYKLYKYDVK